MKEVRKWQKVVYLVALLCMGMAMEASSQSRLTGIPIGSKNVDYGTGQSSTTKNTPACAFDGNPDTYYASLAGSNTWVGLDLETPHVITRVGWMPRNGQEGRVQLALFEGANNADFSDALPLYLVPEQGYKSTYSRADVHVSRGFRYVRYVGPNDARCNVAEVEFYGYEGAGDDTQFYQVTNLPTVSIHTYAGTDPQDKVNDMPSNMVITYDGGTRIQEYPMLIRGRGNASWGFPKKPYRIKFNDGKSHHMLKDSPLESPAKAKKWTLINNYGDKTLMRNCVAFEMSRRLKLAYTPYCQPVDVILNGEYKGCYQLCDQLTVDKDRVNITEMTAQDNEGEALTGGYLVEVDAYANQETSWFSSSHGIPVTIKSPSDDDITPQQSAYIMAEFNLLEQALWSSSFSDEQTGYRMRLDVESFLRHFIVGEFAGNTDTYWSTYMYKDRNQVPFSVGPCWDFDLAMDNDVRIYPVNNRTNWVYRTGGSAASGMASFVTRALQDPYTSARLKGIWADMRRSGQFSKESMVAYVDSMAQQLDASQRLNFIRWPILNSKVHQNPAARGSYSAEVEVVRGYLRDRIEWIDNFLGYDETKVYRDSTYYISMPDQLVEFGYAVNHGANRSVAYLSRDIDMKDFGSKFEPIGNGMHPFMGTFDGRGHTISNLHITGGDNCGLFGTVSGGAHISDFVFDSSCSISGGSYVGLVGMSLDGGTVTIERVGNEATITGTGRNVAGIIGCNMHNACQYIIRDCYNAGNVSGSLESAAISGWLGADAQVTGCWNIGEVTGVEGDSDMARHTGDLSFPGCYSLSGRQVTQVSQDEVKSGALCYKLNEPKGETPLWYQNLHSDEHPTFGASHGQVVRNPDGTYSNEMFMAGDVQKDERLTLTDADWEAEHIVGRTPDDFCATNADANEDGTIDVLDVVDIVGRTVGQQPYFHEETSTDAYIYSSTASLKAGNSRNLKVWLTSPKLVTACQFDLLLEGGLSIDTSQVTGSGLFTNTHVLKVGGRSEAARILVYSTNNASFGNRFGTLLTLMLRADEDFAGGSFVLANQVLTLVDGTYYQPATKSYSVTLAKTYVEQIVLSDSALTMTIGDNRQIGVTVLPMTATFPAVKWTSSSQEVASVDDHGAIEALSPGTATITARSIDGTDIRAKVQVTVIAPTGVMDIKSIPEDAEVYSLTGVRLARPTAPGVYIINGNKVLVK